MDSKEQIIKSEDHLKDALNNFSEKKKNNIIIEAIDSADDVMTNMFPQACQNAYVTGLKGHYTFSEKSKIGWKHNARMFYKGDISFWSIWWDFDQHKGPHVNANFGAAGNAVEFAYLLNPDKYEDNDPKKTMKRFANRLNTEAKYDYRNLPLLWPLPLCWPPKNPEHPRCR